jgi:hypothetical protein
MRALVRFILRQGQKFSVSVQFLQLLLMMSSGMNSWMWWTLKVYFWVVGKYWQDCGLYGYQRLQSELHVYSISCPVLDSRFAVYLCIMHVSARNLQKICMIFTWMSIANTLPPLQHSFIPLMPWVLVLIDSILKFWKVITVLFPPLPL